jgi:hypothetical protein
MGNKRPVTGDKRWVDRRNTTRVDVGRAAMKDSRRGRETDMMKRTNRNGLVVLLACAAALGCGDGDDTSGDVADDAAADDHGAEIVTDDGGEDAADADADADVVPDVEDVPVDGSEDVPADVPPDVPVEGSEDVPPDVPSDVPVDAPPDVVEDVPSEGSFDHAGLDCASNPRKCTTSADCIAFSDYTTPDCCTCDPYNGLCAPREVPDCTCFVDPCMGRRAVCLSGECAIE